MVSSLGYMKARIIQAHFEDGRLVVLKSKLYDFSTPESCDQNLGLFMLYLASDMQRRNLREDGIHIGGLLFPVLAN